MATTWDELISAGNACDKQAIRACLIARLHGKASLLQGMLEMLPYVHARAKQVQQAKHTPAELIVTTLC